MKTKFRAFFPSPAITSAPATASAHAPAPASALFRTLTIAAASLILLCAGFVSGCSSSPGNRIRKNQELFDSLPPQAQTSIRAGKVEVGFTPDMVRLALGEPDRLYVRTSERGSTEVWAYAAKSFAPSVSLGLGFGAGMGRGAGMGTGIGISTGGGDRADDRMRVLFEGGKVSAIEQASTR